MIGDVQNTFLQGESLAFLPPSDQRYRGSQQNVGVAGTQVAESAESVSISNGGCVKMFLRNKNITLTESRYS
jgi:hypothetical protein